jgi:hypothetical protein
MATTEERMRILKMIEEKQISAADGAKLLEALQSNPANGEGGAGAPGRARWLRVRVTDRNSGRSKVNVNIPIGLMEVGLKMGARFAPDMQNMDISAIQTAIREGMQGKILEVDDDEDGEHVEVFVE